MEGSQAVHFGGFDFRSGIGEETLSSPSPLSSGVYTKGQLQVLASLELLHVLRKGGDQVAAFGGGGLEKQNLSEFFVGFRGFCFRWFSWVFVGFRWLSWVFVGFAFFPFCRCSPPVFVPFSPAILGWKQRCAKGGPPRLSSTDQATQGLPTTDPGGINCHTNRPAGREPAP